MVISGSIVGSGELVLTSSLGAQAGFVLLWWLLAACWIKSLVQAEFARYIIVSGDTYLRALNRIPGQVTVAGNAVSWTLWISLLIYIPGVVGMGGILGGAGQALSLLYPAADASALTFALALVTSAILFSGSYFRLERVMLLLVAAFTLATVASAVALQFTPFRVTPGDIAEGLSFGFPPELLVLALAVYGATGVNAAEISTYSYWCIEKGYPAYIGSEHQEPGWVERARGWVGVLKLDVWVTLFVLTCATVPFYLLGAAVLHSRGESPQGLETLHGLSYMFTETLGPWSIWLFALAAFCILFSSAVAGFGGTARILPDYLVEFGVLRRSNLNARRTWIRAYGTIAPLAALGIYMLVQDPLILLSIGALGGALLLPIQSGSTLWLQRRFMDHRVAPGSMIRAALWLVFGLQAVLAALVIRYVVIWP